MDLLLLLLLLQLGSSRERVLRKALVRPLQVSEKLGSTRLHALLLVACQLLLVETERAPIKARGRGLVEDVDLRPEAEDL